MVVKNSEPTNNKTFKDEIISNFIYNTNNEMTYFKS